MASWVDLNHELNLWQAAGATPAFWWRDDDAGAPEPALERLLDIAERHQVPLHLAVVPSWAGSALADRLRAARDVYVLQHGFAHINHEPAGLGASEIGEHRSLAQVQSDLREGWSRLQEVGFDRLLPVLAPPWNRVGEAVLPHLPTLGYRILSTGYDRNSCWAAPGLMRVNVHADPIRWRQGPAFRGVEATLACVVEHLAMKRMGEADREEPTGLTTHHLQSTDEVLGFVDQLVERLARHPAAEWVRLPTLIQQMQAAQ